MLFLINQLVRKLRNFFFSGFSHPEALLSDWYLSSGKVFYTIFIPLEIKIDTINHPTGAYMQIGSYKIINSGGIQIDDIGFEVKSILRVCNIKGANCSWRSSKKLVFRLR